MATTNFLRVLKASCEHIPGGYYEWELLNGGYFGCARNLSTGIFEWFIHVEVLRGWGAKIKICRTEARKLWEIISSKEYLLIKGCFFD